MWVPLGLNWAPQGLSHPESGVRHAQGERFGDGIRRRVAGGCHADGESPSPLEHWALLGELGVPPDVVVLPGCPCRAASPQCSAPELGTCMVSLLTPLLARHAAMARGDISGR